MQDAVRHAGSAFVLGEPASQHGRHLLFPWSGQERRHVKQLPAYQVPRAQRCKRAALQPGDEIMVLPKIQTKSVELTRGITQIIYQIAIAAKVLLDL